MPRHGSPRSTSSTSQDGDLDPSGLFRSNSQGRIAPDVNVELVEPRIVAVAGELNLELKLIFCHAAWAVVWR